MRRARQRLRKKSKNWGNSRVAGRGVLMGAKNAMHGLPHTLYRWLPLVLALLSLIFSPPAPALAINKVTYKGVTPGISTLDDTLRLLGKPVAKVISDERTVCKYRYVQVNILKKTNKVMFILIYDPTFRDVNGFSLGSSYAQIYEKLKVEASGNTVADLENGIGYIFSAEGIVEQIVYGMVR